MNEHKNYSNLVEAVKAHFNEYISCNRNILSEECLDSEARFIEKSLESINCNTDSITIVDKLLIACHKFSYLYESDEDTIGFHLLTKIKPYL